MCASICAYVRTYCVYTAQSVYQYTVHRLCSMQYVVPVPVVQYQYMATVTVTVTVTGNSGSTLVYRVAGSGSNHRKVGSKIQNGNRKW